MRATALILCCLAVAACAEPAPGQPASEQASDVRFVTDPATGCDYVVYAGYKAGGITPRLKPDGSPYCRGSTP